MRNMLHVVLALAILHGCKDSHAPDNGGGQPPFVLPPVPESVRESNVFSVEFFSDLSGSGDFFADHAYGYLSSHILSIQGKRPLVHMIDRASYIYGESSAVVRTAMICGGFPYFAQSGPSTSGRMYGTAMITTQHLFDFDGYVDPDAGIYMSGPVFQIPMTTLETVTVYSSVLGSTAQVKAMVEAKRYALAGEAIIIGLVPMDLADEIKAYVESRQIGMRFDYAESDCSHTVFAMMQPAYVCRGFTLGQIANLKYHLIRIERLYE